MEKRRHERTSIEPLEITIEELYCNERKYENVDLLIREVSSEGIRFSSSIEFDSDDIVQLHLPSIDRTPLVTGRIAWKKGLDTGGFLYGLHVHIR